MGSVQLLLSAMHHNIWVRRLICFFTVHDKEFVTEEEVERDHLITGPYWPFTCRRCGLVSDRESYLVSPPYKTISEINPIQAINRSIRKKSDIDLLQVSSKLAVIDQTQYLGISLPYWNGYMSFFIDINSEIQVPLDISDHWYCSFLDGFMSAAEEHKLKNKDYNDTTK